VDTQVRLNSRITANVCDLTIMIKQTIFGHRHRKVTFLYIKVPHETAKARTGFKFRRIQ